MEKKRKRKKSWIKLTWWEKKEKDWNKIAREKTSSVQELFIKFVIGKSFNRHDLINLHYDFTIQSEKWLNISFWGESIQVFYLKFRLTECS